MTAAEITAALQSALATADRLDAIAGTETRAEAWNILMAHAENLERKQRAGLSAMLDQASRITPNQRAAALMKRTASRLDATLVDRP